MAVKLLTGLVCSSLLSVAIADGDSGGGDSSAPSVTECPDSKILSGKMMSDIPWNGIYPIRIAGVSITGGKPPYGASKKMGCLCEDDLGVPKPGLTNSLWEPARVVELVREPGCFMSLAGAEMGVGDKRNKGKPGSFTGEKRGEIGLWHYHYYAFPLLLMLELWYPGRCGDGLIDFDLMYMSEVDPTWYSDELAYFTQPEASLFTSIKAAAACSIDAISTTFTPPTDELYWCAGSWGPLYNFTGRPPTPKHSTAAQTSLLATRAVASLHRKGLARKTIGDDTLCRPKIFPTIPKSQYKMSLFYPIAETGGGVGAVVDEGSGSSGEGSGSSGEGSNNGDNTDVEIVPPLGEDSRGTHWIGELDYKWGSWRFPPNKQDGVYILWRWNDCCNTAY